MSTTNLEIVLHLTGGKAELSVQEACRLKGISVAAYKNALQRGTPQFETTKLVRRRILTLQQVAAAFGLSLRDGEELPAKVEPATPAKRKAGRPRKYQ